MEGGRPKVLFRRVRMRMVMEWEVSMKVFRLVWVEGVERRVGDGKGDGVRFRIVSFETF